MSTVLKKYFLVFVCFKSVVITFV